MDEQELLTNLSLRDANADNVYVLNKIKALMTIPKTDFITGQMVADYYEVPEATIKTLLMRHRNELLDDGIRCVVAEDFLKIHDETLKITVLKGKKHITYSNGLEFDFPNRGMIVYPRRAVLRMGMLLRDSDIAKAVRTALLDIEETRSIAVSGDLMQIINMQSERINQQSEQIDKLINLVETLLASPTSHAKPLVTLEKPKDWYEEVNDLCKEIRRITHDDRNTVLSQAYRILNNQYGLCIEQYRTDYQNEVHRRASMLETLHWVETERNTNTHGLLAAVLSTILDQVKAA